MIIYATIWMINIIIINNIIMIIVSVANTVGPLVTILHIRNPNNVTVSMMNILLLFVFSSFFCFITGIVNVA